MSKPLFMKMPSIRLAAIVQCYWVGEDDVTDSFPIIPDGCIDVVIRCRGAYQTHVSVYGSSTQYSEHSIVPGHRYIGLRFLPGQARHFLEIPAWELTDAQHDIQSDFIDRLKPSANEVEMEDAVALVEAACLNWIEKHPFRSIFLDRLVHRLTQDPSMPLGDFCFRHGISERHLRRRFKEMVGLNPKLFARIQRAHRLRTMVSSDERALSELALEAGYADQSHMQKEFKTFFGATPGKLILPN